jgi:hypothetical protein
MIKLGNGMEVKIESKMTDWVEDGHKHPIMFGRTWDYKAIEEMFAEINEMAPGLAKTAAEGAAWLIKEAYKKANK